MERKTKIAEDLALAVQESGDNLAKIEHAIAFLANIHKNVSVAAALRVIENNIALVDSLTSTAPACKTFKQNWKALCQIYRDRLTLFEDIVMNEKAKKIPVNSLFLYIFLNASARFLAELCAANQMFYALGKIRSKFHGLLVLDLFKIAAQIPSEAFFDEQSEELKDFFDAVFGNIMLELPVDAEYDFPDFGDPARICASIGFEAVEWDFLDRIDVDWALPCDMSSADLEMAEYPPPVDDMLKFVRFFACKIDNETGLLSMAAKFVDFCSQHTTDPFDLSDMHETMNEACFIVYEKVPPMEITFEEYSKLGDVDRLWMMCKDLEREEIVTTLGDRCIDIIRRYNSTNSISLMEHFAQKTSVDGLEMVEEILNQYFTDKAKNPLKEIFPTPISIITFVSTAFVHCERNDMWKTMERLLAMFPPNFESVEKFSSEKTIIEIGKLLFTKYHVQKRYVEIKNLSWDSASLVTILERMRLPNTDPKKGLSDMECGEVISDMKLVLRKSGNKEVTESKCYDVYLFFLLREKKFSLVKKVVDGLSDATDALVRGSRFFLNKDVKTIEENAACAEKCLSFLPESNVKAFEMKMIEEMLHFAHLKPEKKDCPHKCLAEILGESFIREVLSMNRRKGPLTMTETLLKYLHQYNVVKEIARMFGVDLEQKTVSTVYLMCVEDAKKAGDFKVQLQLLNSVVAQKNLDFDNRKHALQLLDDCMKDPVISQKLSRGVMTTFVSFFLLSCSNPETLHEKLEVYRDLETKGAGYQRQKFEESITEVTRMLTMPRSEFDDLSAISMLEEFPLEEFIANFGLIKDMLLNTIPEKTRGVSSAVKLLQRRAQFFRSFLIYRSVDTPEIKMFGKYTDSSKVKTEVDYMRRMGTVASAMCDIMSQIPAARKAVDAPRLFCNIETPEAEEYRVDTISALIRDSEGSAGTSDILYGMAGKLGINVTNIAFEVIRASFCGNTPIDRLKSELTTHASALRNDPAVTMRHMTKMFCTPDGINGKRLDNLVEYFRIVEETVAMCESTEGLDESQFELLNNFKSLSDIASQLNAMSCEVDFFELLDEKVDTLSLLSDLAMTSKDPKRFKKVVSSLGVFQTHMKREKVITASAFARSVLEKYLRLIRKKKLAVESHFESDTFNFLLMNLDDNDRYGYATAILSARRIKCETKLHLVDDVLQVSHGFNAKYDDKYEIVRRVAEIKNELREPFTSMFDHMCVEKDASTLADEFVSKCFSGGVRASKLYTLFEYLKWPKKKSEISASIPIYANTVYASDIKFDRMVAALAETETLSAEADNSSEGVCGFARDCFVQFAEFCNVFIDNESHAFDNKLALLRCLSSAFSHGFLVSFKLVKTPLSMKIKSLCESRFSHLPYDIFSSATDLNGPLDTEACEKCVRTVLASPLSPQQLQCISSVCCEWQSYIFGAKTPYEDAALHTCWMLVFSYMIKAGMASDVVKDKRMFRGKFILTEEEELRLSEQLSGQLAASFCLTSPYKSVSSKTSQLIEKKDADGPTTVSTLCPHTRTGLQASEDELELYKLTVENGQLDSLTDYPPATLAEVLADKHAEANAFAKKQMAESAPVRGTALFVNYNKMSTLLRTTDAYAALISKLGKK